MRLVRTTILTTLLAAACSVATSAGVEAAAPHGGFTAAGGPYMVDRDPCRGVPYGQPVLTGASWASGIGIPLTAADGATLDVVSNWDGTTCVRGGAASDVSTAWGEGYQCTQLAFRAADVEWHEDPSWWWRAGMGGGAAGMYDAAPRLPIPLQVVANGSGSLPSPGDILIWNATSVYTGGHAAVVSSVDTTNHLVWFVSQNSSYALYGMPYVGSTLDPAQNFGLPVRGWITKPVPGRGIVLRGDGTSGYRLDAFGGIHAFGGAAAVAAGPMWPDWDMARGIVLRSDGISGYVLDGWGGIHPFGGAPRVAATGYWPGWDIARGIVLRPDGVSGYVLDGFGALHPFGGAPPVFVTGYWRGWDIARGVVLRSDGVSGYVLDGWGALHPFGVAGDLSPPVRSTSYWPGWDIARAVALSSGDQGGYVLDGWGGLHQFGAAPWEPTSWYWPGHDSARAVALRADGTSGYVLDALGTIHAFAGAPPLP